MLGGKLILFAIDRLIEIDGNLTFSEPISDIWDDVLPNDLHNEGGVIFKKGKKQEKLMQRILELTTERGDIVLDYHLGSGTTAAVAHKMSRVYIGIEQLDYGKNDCVVRLRNVIGSTNDKQSYDRRGISESYGWQGGGSFVYCELAKANQNFVDEIEKAVSSDELLDIWKRMQETGFLSWKIDPKTINENAKDLSDLSVDDAKRFLIECLDKNLLYVPYSEIDNSEFRISDDDKKINNQFYS
ncbi:site-specific DNA-methyltransferase [Phocaeicola plebeius]|uniref:DNA methyltransferase n=1 Tax=Phocaeicola plebeius TaxID=310297 RepID=UPI00195A4BE8|nr:DNA methyltransferase [Phocaeicola plebeius]MBM6964818.1 site-specific DNA-methyltransferase [Phocaeicola plebeius]